MKKLAFIRLVAVQAVVLASGIVAQTQFSGAASIPTFDGLGTPIAFADVDGDGDLDLWAGARLLLREDRADGTRFVDAPAVSVPPALGEATAVVFGDVDGDGDQDVVLGRGGVDLLLINDGQARFALAAQPLPAPNTMTSDVALFDADGDGDLDCYAAMTEQLVGTSDRFYRNDGTGRFTDDTAMALPSNAENSSSVACGDLDADGDVDLVVGALRMFSGAGIDRVLLNDGTGQFVTASGGRALPAPALSTHDVELIDVDGDADLDAVMLDLFSSLFQGVLRVAINDGSGQLSDGGVSPPMTFSPLWLSMAVGDVDGDLDVDVVAGVVWLNDGAGGFTTSGARLGVGALADIDGDADLDLATGGGLFANDGEGAFEPRTHPRSAQPEAGFDFSVGDLNGDGITDVGWSADRLANRRAYLGSEGIDLDGDGVAEIVRFSPMGFNVLAPSPITIWEDDGNGAYLSRTAGVLTPAISFSQGISRGAVVAVADIDGDGDEDFVLATRDFSSFIGFPLPCPGAYELVVYHSEAGALRRTDLQLTGLDASIAAMDWADVDADGDLDLALALGHAGCAGSDRLLINDGTGSFADESAQRLLGTRDETTQIAFADVDGDGDADLVRTLGGVVAPAPSSSIWLNDGTGRFVDGGPGRLPATLDGSFAISSGDLDGDGDVDLAGSVLALNDGNGFYADATMQLVGIASLTLGTRAADLDLDGDLDLVGLGGALINRRRHLEILDRPRLGQVFRMRAAATPPAALVLPLIGFRSAVVPTPFGFLGIDPLETTPLPALMLPGSAELSVRVPIDPGLLGLRLQSQALFVHMDGSGEIRLSNAVTAVVRDLWLR